MRPPVQTRDDLDVIRDTYASYASSGRYRLWDRSNRGMRRQAAEAQAAIANLISRSSPLPGGASFAVLDLGCGDGSLADVVRDAGVTATWTGVDLRQSVVEHAAAAHPWATFVEAAADNLPFSANSFDVVVCAVLFSSLPSAVMEARVAREIRRVLRPGGWLVWYDLRYNNPWNKAVHGITRSRIGGLFNGWTADLQTYTLLPPITRRLGRTTPFTYPLLHAIPPLRSHLLGRLRPPA